MKKNYSYTYLLPLLAEQVYFNLDILKNIKNTYLFSNKHLTGNLFFILCSFNYSDPSFSDLESRLMSNDLLIETYDIGKDTLYVFKFPKEHQYEFNAFVQGKYSTFKIDAKKAILSFWTTFYGSNPSFMTNVLIKIKQILFKDKKLKKKMEEDLSSDDYQVKIEDDAELGYLIDAEKEQFIFPEIEEINLEKIKNIF